MREELTIDVSTGEHSTRKFTTQENNAVDVSRQQWLENVAQREKDIALLKERSLEDPVFAALLRVLGVN